MLRECVILVSVCVFGVGSLSGRGFFCRDPDTGKLHPTNSTWAASSFCGKYHCKLKRKNITSSEYAPQRQINITTIQLLGKNLTVADIQKEDNMLVKKNATDILNTGNETKPDVINNATIVDIQGIRLIDDIDDKNTSEKDRYLTAKEIKSLTEMLQTVKKGDIDAIVEIYNLAQDIYKELDKTSTDHVLQEAMSTAKTLEKEIIESEKLKKVTKNDHASYWYEPLANVKIRVADLVRPDVLRTDINPEIPAIAVGMVPAASMTNVALNPVKSTIVQSIRPPLPAIEKMSDTFFNSILTQEDFKKLPYYYPMSDFQRESSYKHNHQKTLTTKAGTPALTTTTPAPTSTPTTIRNLAFSPVTIKLFHTNIKAKYQNELRPSVFLPYPFTNIQHYNSQKLYREKLFEKLNVRKKVDTNSENTMQRRVDKQNNVVLMNPDLENFQDLQVRASMKKENVAHTNIKQEDVRKPVERRKPDWQTDSLPQQILEEVRAHIQERQRLFINPVSLRKKVKLERVAKLLNMDEIIRTKRSVKSEDETEPLNSEIYEVYIEKTT